MQEEEGGGRGAKLKPRLLKEESMKQISKSGFLTPLKEVEEEGRMMMIKKKSGRLGERRTPDGFYIPPMPVKE